MIGPYFNIRGDPQQLEQPQQAVHPHDSGVAALSHILNGRDTIPDELGLFLASTWRLHPDICRFTSEQYYNDRLTSRPDLRVQEIFGDSPYIGSGLQVVTVDHQGNQNRSLEEVSEISRIFERLLNGQHQWARMSIQFSAMNMGSRPTVASKERFCSRPERSEKGRRDAYCSILRASDRKQRPQLSCTNLWKAAGSRLRLSPNRIGSLPLATECRFYFAEPSGVRHFQMRPVEFLQ